MRVPRRFYVATAGLLLLVLGPYTGARPQQPADNTPRIIVSGFDAYKAEGPEAGIKAWMKGSPLEGSRDVLSQANNLRSIQDAYGAYRRFELVSVHDVSPSVRILFMTIAFDKGPLFARFVAYRSAPTDDWILTSFDFNTKPEQIFPLGLGLEK